MTELIELEYRSKGRARKLRARERRRTGRSRGFARQLRQVCEEQAAAARELRDLERRIEHLENRSWT